jgi:undecaprenyl-diphosphatase
MICDTVVHGFMETIETPVLTAVSKMIAPIFDPIVFVVLTLIIAPYIYMKSSKRNGIFFGAMVFIAGGLILALKQIFGRLRPVDGLVQELSHSFPSGHATMAVVFFGLLVYLFASKKYKIRAGVVAGILVLIIGLSRVYLRVHWLTDVLGGFVLGGIILAIGIWILRKSS